jgi:hypothetical protein
LKLVSVCSVSVYMKEEDTCMQEEDTCVGA